MSRSIKKIIPSPFSIAIILTVLTFILALLFTDPDNKEGVRFFKLIGFWEKGFWELLSFTMQMMLILVLGHALALTKGIGRIINLIVRYCTTTAKAAFIITLAAMIMSFLNWGLGLVFGAILARKAGEYAAEKGFNLNYPLIGAAGYSGLMVWHGGFSGSAPLLVSEPDHFLVEKIGQIPWSETLFSGINIFTTLALLVLIPTGMFLIAKTQKNREKQISADTFPLKSLKQEALPEDALDGSRIFSILIAVFMIFVAIYDAISNWEEGFLSLNYVNFILFSLGLLLHKNVSCFIKAVKNAITGSVGILIQFPLYAGIMGIMKYSGLSVVFTNFFVDISTQTSFPIFTFISAGIVNIFVPSGGGQWAVQGEIIVDAARQLGISVPKSIMALVYGDQLTNMLQPFWALPLLAITGLRASRIFRYTFYLFLMGGTIMLVSLVLF